MTFFYNKTVKESLQELNTDKDLGLSSREVELRRQKYGENFLNIKTIPLWRKIIEPFTDLFMIILLIALALSIIQGSIPEVIIISIDIFCDALIFYIQDYSTGRILKNLKKKVTHKITAIRDGKDCDLDSTELVPGDIVYLKEGDRIPADGRIIAESGILTNESMLTGESDSIAKDARAISGNKKIYEQKNMVFSGSFVITGTGKMLVTATGNSTEYGRIASLASGSSVASPIQEKINSLVVKIAAVILIVAVFVLAIQLLNGMNFFDSAKFTLALIVSAVPEDLPIATAIILAIGATRMAKKKALIRELRSIESIGVVTTVASDKTGTLTENKLSVRELWSLSSSLNIGDKLALTVLPESESGDPMDICIWNYLSKEHISSPASPIHSYAFDQSIRMSGNLTNDKSKLKIYLKGAPETIIKHCDLTAKEQEKITFNLEKFANFGYKVLALAEVSISHEINELSRLEKSDKFKFLGLVAVSDTVRKEARPAIIEAREAGVKVKMITGDHAGTAFAIARELGLTKNRDEVLDCSKLATIDDDILSEKVKTSTVFARVTPEDKYRILEAIKKSEIVAMTGDGVNDVPALTNAHVGIAMGDGPSIVGDASDIILLDNNFKSIVEAIKEGRIILANIRRMLMYLLATNAGEVLTQIIALTFGHTQLLLPIQILWVNLVTDSIMIIPIGLEPAESHFLHEKPEDKSAPILSRLYIERIIIIALTMSAVTLSVYFISSVYLTHEQSNTLAFLALVVMQWANAFTTRGIYDTFIHRLLKVKNLLFLFASILAISIQILASTTTLKSFLGIAEVPFPPLILTILASFFIPLLTVEFHKFYHKHHPIRSK